MATQPTMQISWRGNGTLPTETSVGNKKEASQPRDAAVPREKGLTLRNMKHVLSELECMGCGMITLTRNTEKSFRSSDLV